MIAPSERVWALVSGLATVERANRILTIFQTYTDDSGRGDPEISLLVGLVSTVSRWAEFSDRWRESLIGLSYFKMQEASALRGQFFGILAEERDRVVKNLCRLIASHVMYGVSGIVDAKAWERMVLGKYSRSTNSPYYFLTTDILNTVMHEQYMRGLAGEVDFIFDTQSEAEFSNVIKAWNEAKNQNHPEQMPRYFRRRMGQPPICLDDKITMPLQAADLVAWFLRRAYRDQLADTSTPIVEMMSREIPDGLLRGTVFDSDAIKEHFDMVESMGYDPTEYHQSFQPSPRQRRRLAKL